ncbi:MAG TPA: serine hydrolase domain-containing protein [Candidatus Binataceae bacterium]|nr:serine hydrolase domain-containing protein [Candidatus Binataceae bacterium]
MASSEFFADSPRDVGLDPNKVEALFERAAREINEGLLPSAQIAIARNGKVAAMRTVGHAVQGGTDQPATNDTLYAVFSCTKAIMSAASWILIGEGKLDLRERAADIVPEFASNGKDAITVEQILLHVAGFPNAPYAQSEWNDRARRLERFANWRLEFPVGDRFFYHPTSGFWVIAEIVERRTGMDFRDFVRTRIAEPLGLNEMYLGLPRELNRRVADLVWVGDPLSPDELRKMGMPVIPENEVNEKLLLGFNNPDVRAAGVPGGGGIMTAAELALFYQGLLHNRARDGSQIWKPEVLSEAIRPRSGDYFDPFMRHKVNRGLGVVIAGGDGKANYRGFGKTNSPDTFGHGGAGGQIAWADPATGISLGYCTNGYDRNDVRQGRRGVAISSLAAVCAAG